MMLSILQHTPVWVFALFAGLLVLGLHRMRAHETTAARLAILPVAMTLFSLFGLTQAFGPGIATIGPWAVALTAALGVGGMLPARDGVRDGVQYSSVTGKLHVPGSGLPLALMMTLFFLRYAVAVLIAMNPSLRQDALFVAGVAALYGLASGCFVARALRTWRSRDVSSADARTVLA